MITSENVEYKIVLSSAETFTNICLHHLPITYMRWSNANEHMENIADSSLKSLFLILVNRKKEVSGKFPCQDNLYCYPIPLQGLLSTVYKQKDGRVWDKSREGHTGKHITLSEKQTNRAKKLPLPILLRCLSGNKQTRRRRIWHKGGNRNTGKHDDLLGNKKKSKAATEQADRNEYNITEQERKK